MPSFSSTRPHSSSEQNDDPSSAPRSCRRTHGSGRSAAMARNASSWARCIFRNTAWRLTWSGVPTHRGSYPPMFAKRGVATSGTVST